MERERQERQRKPYTPSAARSPAVQACKLCGLSHMPKHYKMIFTEQEGMGEMWELKAFGGGPDGCIGDIGMLRDRYLDEGDPDDDADAVAADEVDADKVNGDGVLYR